MRPPQNPTLAPARDADQRRADVQAMLAQERHLWLATAGDRRPHLIPLAYAWDGAQLVLLTERDSRTVRNLRRSGRARAALGSTRDVVLADATVSFSEPAQADPQLAQLLDRLPLDPHRVPGAIVVHLRPYRMLAWRGPSEMDSRTVMADGRWC
ncbi:MAG: pyridoxamine 5'-phosphate oxidase family protein [Micromonosporaceae bacterium]|nr:pyridoxamine 5'-phosphate oxidase family protein [Micromonosporaceae bacterium]